VTTDHWSMAGSGVHWALAFLLSIACQGLFGVEVW